MSSVALSAYSLTLTENQSKKGPQITAVGEGKTYQLQGDDQELVRRQNNVYQCTMEGPQYVNQCQEVVPNYVNQMSGGSPKLRKPMSDGGPTSYTGK